MPITEFATLQFKDIASVSSPSIHQSFHKLSTLQSKWSGYPLQFFLSSTDQTIIYLLSGWRDVPAHYEWIKTEENQGLLTELGPYLDVKDLTHVEVDFELLKEANLERLIVVKTDQDFEGDVYGSGKDAEKDESKVYYFVKESATRGGEDREVIQGDRVRQFERP